MKHTSLYDRHKAAGATLVPFAGWNMPLSYGSTVAEVQAVRRHAGLFDVSHMGEVAVTGSEALRFLQAVTANDVSRLVPGQAQYSLLLNEQGGVLDDILVYRRDEQNYLLVLNAGCKEKDWEWLQEQAACAVDVSLEDISDRTALLAVQGPEAVRLLQGLCPDLQIPRFHFAPVNLQGISAAFSRTGYTGEDGFEIFCAWDQAILLWDLILQRGAVPCGLAARDVLRLEAAYPLYGHELDAETNALECGVGWAIKTGKGAFTGQKAILRAKAAGVPRRLVGLKMTERAIPREGCLVKGADGTEIGQVTSGTFSPTVGAGIALARVSASFALLETPVQVEIRGRLAPAIVTGLPFYRNGV